MYIDFWYRLWFRHRFILINFFNINKCDFPKQLLRLLKLESICRDYALNLQFFNLHIN